MDRWGGVGAGQHRAVVHGVLEIRLGVGGWGGCGAASCRRTWRCCCRSPSSSSSARSSPRPTPTTPPPQTPLLPDHPPHCSSLATPPGRQAGEAEGRQPGEAEGRQPGEAEGRQAGQAEGRQAGEADWRAARGDERRARRVAEAALRAETGRMLFRAWIVWGRFGPCFMSATRRQSPPPAAGRLLVFGFGPCLCTPQEGLIQDTRGDKPVPTHASAARTRLGSRRCGRLDTLLVLRLAGNTAGATGPDGTPLRRLRFLRRRLGMARAVFRACLTGGALRVLSRPSPLLSDSSLVRVLSRPSPLFSESSLVRVLSCPSPLLSESSLVRVLSRPSPLFSESSLVRVLSCPSPLLSESSLVRTRSKAAAGSGAEAAGSGACPWRHSRSNGHGRGAVGARCRRTGAELFADGGV